MLRWSLSGESLKVNGKQYNCRYFSLQKLKFEVRIRKNEIHAVLGVYFIEVRSHKAISHFADIDIFVIFVIVLKFSDDGVDELQIVLSNISFNAGSVESCC